MYSSKDKEQFYLRFLLTKIHKATFYETIYIINKILYNTFDEVV